MKKNILFFCLCSLSAFAQAQTLADTSRLLVFDPVKSWVARFSDVRTHSLGNAFVAFTGPSSSLKTFTLPNSSSLILTNASPVTVGQGGTGTGSTLTGLLLGSASAFTAITSTTTGQIPRCTGSNTFAFGALDLANSNSITGVLPFGNGGHLVTHGRSTAQTAAVSSVATVTVGGADATYMVSANVLVTTSGSENFTVSVDYTDESNTARNLVLSFTLNSSFRASVNSAFGALPYTGQTIHLRCKASTSITIKTSGTFTGCTYNVEGIIERKQ